MAQERERNQDATCYVGNLDDKVTDVIVWELFVQAGPLVNVHMPKDRVTSQHQGFAFVEYLTEEDADYAIRILNMIKVFGKPIRVNKASSDRKNMDGPEAFAANLFIGNLHPDVDEKMLYDTFSAFGLIVQTPKVGRDPETGNSKGYGFISFESFEAADAAIEAMNGQHLFNKPITVQYAYKKDGKGERHGSAAERMLAAKFRTHASSSLTPNRYFAEPGKAPTLAPIPGMPGSGGMPPRPMMGAPGSFPPMPGAPPSFMPGPPGAFIGNRPPGFPTAPPPGFMPPPPLGFPTVPPPGFYGAPTGFRPPVPPGTTPQ